MKITPNSPNNRATSIDQRNKSDSVKATSPAAHVESVMTELTSPVAGAADQDIDFERVAEIKSAIEEGRFRLSSPEIADQLLASVRSFLK